MDAYNTLVIILSVTLAVFLIVGIAAAILAIKFLKKMNVIMDRADNIISDIETISNNVRKLASPLATVAAIFDRLNPRSK